jgi:hypothetical protein
LYAELGTDEGSRVQIDRVSQYIPGTWKGEALSMMGDVRL